MSAVAALTRGAAPPAGLRTNDMTAKRARRSRQSAADPTNLETSPTAGSVLVAPGVLGWLLPSNAPHTRTHVHLAQRVIVPLDGSSLAFRDGRGRLVETRSPVLVPPGVPYATLRSGPRFGVILHPLRDGRRVLVEADEPVVLSGATGDRVRGAAHALLGTAPGQDAGDAQLEFLEALGSPLGSHLDRRVRSVLDALASSPELEPLQLFARRSGISTERMRHLLT